MKLIDFAGHWQQHHLQQQPLILNTFLLIYEIPLYKENLLLGHGGQASYQQERRGKLKVLIP